ncbi:MAG: peptidoglycan DD-metalloendopeptidase family protein [Halieaceae bacterium]|nr:peptidoglycan DD-metalloendopeptidase family protein [Halieaceae bacterium]MCP5187683.1 peptidoglycan DD-metalloendopeptidase family protein [Pseudomonadales bacterium]
MALAASPLALGACLQFDGSLQQGGFIWGKVAPGSVVTLDGEQLDVLADGTTFAGFGRDAAASAELVVSGAQSCRETLQVARREYQIQRVEGVPQKTVTPPPEELERIRREATLVANARAPKLARPDLLNSVLAGFVWPVEGPISGVYGSQRFYNGEPRRPHFGVDVAVPTGTIVRAPAAGRVTLAEPDLYFSGGTVILDHGYRLSSSFLHMSEVSVQVGDELQAGDIIGAVGATGRATGPHLDWRMNWREERIDPQLLAPPMPKPMPMP